MVNGAKLVDCRKQNGVKACFVASQVGLSRQSLYAYERGRRVPSVATLERLAKIYGVTVDELLTTE